MNLDHANVVHRNLAHGLLHLYSDTMAQFSERFSFDILVAKGFASGGNTTTEMQAHLAALQIQMDALQASQEAQGRDIKTMETTHGAKLDELLISVRAFTGPTGASAATSSGGSTSSRPAPSRRGTAAAATSSSNA